MNPVLFVFALIASVFSAPQPPTQAQKAASNNLFTKTNNLLALNAKWNSDKVKSIKQFLAIRSDSRTFNGWQAPNMSMYQIAYSFRNDLRALGLYVPYFQLNDKYVYSGDLVDMNPIDAFYSSLLKFGQYINNPKLGMGRKHVFTDDHVAKPRGDYFYIENVNIMTAVAERNMNGKLSNGGQSGSTSAT